MQQQDLRHDLSCRKIARQPELTCETEFASQPAPHLRRNAEREPPTLRNENGLHGLSIVKTDQIPPGSIERFEAIDDVYPFQIVCASPQIAPQRNSVKHLQYDE